MQVEELAADFAPVKRNMLSQRLAVLTILGLVRHVLRVTPQAVVFITPGSAAQNWE